ncbi:hypothetical protein D9756_011636 [Leucocoprinus leucothites]|uniref:Reverse transcriptase domain-containing protein n=1 Tax=Leucocoprinus leucothites TaxID=201217 RepID=A0A8H5CND7_9AGAR|nr:hypothetical protein D9756_011636 [Leucoagaricus leucothites]
MSKEQERKKSDLKKALNEYNGQGTQTREQASMIIDEIETLEKDKIESLQLSARAHYQEEGERNTKFFFKLGNHLQKPEIIVPLENKNSKLIRDTAGMSKIASEHHKALQETPVRGTNGINHIYKFLEHKTPKGTASNYEALAQKTKEEDILKVLKDSDNGVAPGYNGIPYEFYKYWEQKFNEYFTTLTKGNKRAQRSPDIIGILMEVYNKIEEKGMVNPNFILGAMHLLYKKKERTKIENYRPITLTNTNYKLFTKTIATKLGQMAHTIIHSNQVGFIPNRGLYDHI